MLTLNVHYCISHVGNVYKIKLTNNSQKMTLSKSFYILFLVFAFTLQAVSEETNLTYSEPVLLTSVGQAGDIFIMYGLCKRAGIEVTRMNLATEDSLGNFKTVILVAGGSSKGLGAAKIDVKSETKRGEKLVEACKKKNIPILTFHVGGESRRGVLSDPFNIIAAKAGNFIVVSSDGDKDELFKKIADKNEIIYKHVEKNIEIVPMLKEIFVREDNSKP